MRTWDLLLLVFGTCGASGGACGACDYGEEEVRMPVTIYNPNG